VAVLLGAYLVMEMTVETARSGSGVQVWTAHHCRVYANYRRFHSMRIELKEPFFNPQIRTSPITQRSVKQHIPLSSILGSFFLYYVCAAAQVLPNATYSAGIGNSALTPGGIALLGPTPQSISTNGLVRTGLGFASVSLSATAGPGPSVSASGSVGSPGGGQVFGAEAWLLYYIHLNGPTGSTGQSIPVSVAGSVNVQTAGGIPGSSYHQSAHCAVTIATGSPVQQIYNYVGLFADNDNGVITGACNMNGGSTGCSSNPGPFTDRFNMSVGTPAFVQIDAAIGLTGPANAVSASASVDPTFTLDPSYIAAGYSIAYSTNITMVPQPTILGLSLSGTNLVVNGSNGQSGGTYETLLSTNLALPLNQWTPVATNVLNTSGKFTISATNAVDPNIPQCFYILQVE
jgi:hypothetical protein